MLLRLLPSPTPTQPSPPTILFTLPLPNQPYTSRSLPLPPNLLAHRTLCLHEDLECSNVLLGDKATWISGIIDDVSFSLPTDEVKISFIDGTTSTLPLSEACIASLGKVVEQVQLSFAPAPPAISTSTPGTPRTSTSSIASTSSASSSSSSSSSEPSSPTTVTGFSFPPLTPPQSIRRSTSTLLRTLLSPLLPTSTRSIPPTPAQAPQSVHNARQHRRAARSLLVDSYRRHVLPGLKASLPAAYLPWAMANEVKQRLAEFEALRVDIDTLLSAAGWDAERRLALSPPKRTRSLSASTSSSHDASTDENEDETALPAYTPATSIYPSRPGSPKSSATPGLALNSITPQSYLMTIPPAHDLISSSSTRSKYSGYLARLTRIASRLSAVRRLDSQYHREEGKRKWLENLERSRATERGLRRAWSTGVNRTAATASTFTATISSSLASVSPYAKSTRGSRLWRSFTAEELERVQVKSQASARANLHPAMMDDTSDAESTPASDSDSESGSESDSSLPITPPASIFPDRDRLTRQDLNMVLTKCAKAASASASANGQVQVQVQVWVAPALDGKGEEQDDQDPFADPPTLLEDLQAGLSLSNLEHVDLQMQQGTTLKGDVGHNGDIVKIRIQPYTITEQSHDEEEAIEVEEVEVDSDEYDDETSTRSYSPCPRHIEVLPVPVLKSGPRPIIPA